MPFTAMILILGILRRPRFQRAIAVPEMRLYTREE
jgi:hypothetical protein